MIGIYSFKSQIAGIACVVLAGHAQATTYTALASGNFSSSGTWGGVVPAALTSGDVVVIPSGVTVTLDEDLDMNGMLTLNSGTLALNGHNLNFGYSADLTVNGSGNIDAHPGSGIYINTANGLSSPLTFVSGDVLGNLSMVLGNSTGNVDLGSDILISGTLGLGSGTFSLHDNTLTIAGNGDFSPAGTGTLVGSASSDITVQTYTSLTGALRFSSTGNYLRNLSVNFPDASNTVSLGTSLNIAGNLILASGKINTGTHDLNIMPGCTVIGGSETSYVIAEQGTFTITSIANTAHTFPVGTSNAYCPALAFSAAGSAVGQLSFSVTDGVYANGYNGSMLTGTTPLVNATWYLTSNITSGLNLTLQFFWNTSMEMDGFNRQQAYAAHNINGNWDMASTSSAALSGGLYSITRSGIASGGPFTVADNNSALQVSNELVSSSSITVYPNPATETLYYTAPVTISKANIYDITGRRVKSFVNPGNALSVFDLIPGYYTVQLIGKDFVSVEKFLKAE